MWALHDPSRARRLRALWRNRARVALLAGACLVVATGPALLASPATPDCDLRSAPYLVRLLREADSFRVRTRAALALGSMRSGCPGVVPALLDALARDPEAAVRAAAADSLEGVDDVSALVGVVTAALGDPDAAVRSRAGDAIRVRLGLLPGSGALRLAAD